MTPQQGADRPGRLEGPLVRDESGALVPATWQQAVLALVARLDELRGAGGVRAVASPFHANEDAGLLVRLVDVLGGGEAVFRSARVEAEDVCPGFPKLARRRDLAANVRGLEVLGCRRVGDDAGRGGLDGRAAGSVLLVLGDGLADQPATFGADASLFVHMGEAIAPAAANAHFVLPITTFAEQEGTFTNHEGRVQRFWPALQPPAFSRPAWQVLGVILAGLEDAPAPASAADALLRLGELHDAFAGLSYELLGSRGAPLNEPVQLGAGVVEAG